MNQSSELHAFYENYYDDAVGRKREITAQQTVDHIVSLNKDFPLGSVSISEPAMAPYFRS
jgi:hypothetical protein